MSKITRLFDENCAKYHDRAAIIYAEENKVITRTYGDMETDICVATEILSAQGVRSGDRILAFAPQSYNLTVYMIAAFKMGVSVLYVDIWARQDRLRTAFDKFQPRFVFVNSKTKIIHRFFPEINKINHLINIDELVDDPAMLQIFPEPKDDTIALMTMTTGSMSVPKIAVRTHELLYQQLRLINDNMVNHDRAECILTTSYMYVFANLINGHTTVLPKINLASNNTRKIQNTLNLFKDLHITSIITSPDFCLKTENIYPHLRNLYFGGAILNINEAEAIRAKFNRAEITYIYGATECNLITKTNLDNYIQHLQYEGKTVLGKPVKGTNVKTNEKHEILVSSKALLENYVDQDVTNKVTDEDGTVWHHTGDTGEIVDGELNYLGRTKNDIKIGQKKYFSNQIEQLVINSFRQVDKCAVIQKNGKNALFIEGNHLPSSSKISNMLKSTIGLDKLKVKHLHKIPCDVKHHTKINYKKLEEKIR